MSGGETLLLLPAQRCLDLLPQRLSMGNPRRCLFGRPDSVLISKADDFAEQRERMIKKWDFDIEKEKPVYPPRRYHWMEVVSQAVPATPSASPAREKRESRRRNRVTPYKELLITDFWRVRKFDGSNKAKTEDAQPSSSESSSSE